MVDVRRDILRPPHCTTPATVKANTHKKLVNLRAMKTFMRKEMSHTTSTMGVLDIMGKQEISLKKDKKRRLNGSVFCNMCLR